MPAANNDPSLPNASISISSSSNSSSKKQFGAQAGMWTQAEITEFYAQYSTRYDRDIDANRALYPAPFLLGEWAIGHLLGHEDFLNSLFLSLPGNDTKDTLLPNSTAATTNLAVLDLGVGTGQSCEAFLRHRHPRFRYSFLGIDASPEMMERARERGLDHLLVHNLESYPYPDQVHEYASSGYDIVMCVGVMDFISNPLGFLRHARSLMRQPPKPSSSDASASAAEPERAPAVLCLTLPERHAHSDLSSFSRQEMQDLFQECGLQVERHQRLFGYRDSVSQLVQFYHGWLVTIAT